jgi:hypothetical protein
MWLRLRTDVGYNIQLLPCNMRRLPKQQLLLALQRMAARRTPVSE